MKVLDKPIYQCEHCRKLYQIKSYAEKHETKCRQNPANDRPCYWCINLEMREEEYHFDTYCGSDSRIVNALYCKAREIFIHPQKVADSDMGPYEFGDTCNEVMPKSCDIFNKDLEDRYASINPNFVESMKKRLGLIK